jgi:DNA-binding transcriptional MerR regulator
LFEEIFHPVKTGTEQKEITYNGLIKATGASKSLLQMLKKAGLFMGVETKRGRYYDDLDVHIVQLAKKLMELGFTSEDLSVYHKYVESIRDEVNTIHNRLHELHKAHDTKEIHLSDLFSATASLKKYLTIKVGRQTALGFHT